MKTIDYRLKKKMNEIFIVEPNDLGIGFLTNWYHRVVKYFKTAPFIFIVPLSFLVGYLIYLVFGFLVIKLVSWLQYGF